jgi:hypothetical protein
LILAFDVSLVSVYLPYTRDLISDEFDRIGFHIEYIINNTKNQLDRILNKFLDRLAEKNRQVQM